MKLADLAVVIPTLNEEKFIGNLLDSISYQSVLPKDIFVVDAYSKDKTRQEVKERQSKLPQLKFFQIPRSTISKQRNLGVNKTLAKHLLFLDADMVLKDPRTLEKYIGEVEAKKPDIAASYNYPLSNFWKDQVFFLVMNTLYRLIKPFWPMANGMNIYARGDFFKKIGGFDEDLRIGEDHELVQRATKFGGKFSYLNTVKVYTSVRRYSREGRIKFSLKMIRSFFYIQLHGYKGNPIEYKFGRHNDQ